MTEITTMLGLLAGGLTTIATVPQVLKAWKTKHTKDISLVMYIMLTTGVLLWLVYGLIINDTPIIAANALTLILTSMVLFLKIRHG